MVKKQPILFVIGLLLITLTVVAQKPPLQITSGDKWPDLGIKKLTPDGNYLLYTSWSKETGRNLVIQASVGTWKREVAGVGSAEFSNNGQYVVYQKSYDTLFILELGTNLIEGIAHVASYRLSTEGKRNWLAYSCKATKELVVRDLVSGRDKIYTSVVGYEFSTDGTYLLLQTEQRNTDTTLFQLKYVSLAKGTVINIWQGNSKVEYYGQSPNGYEVSFIVQEKQGDRLCSFLYYYKPELHKPQVLVSDSSLSRQLVIQLRSGWPQFSKDGATVFFGVERLKNREDNNDGAAEKTVTIWNTTDSKLKSQEAKEQGGGLYGFVSAVDLSNLLVTNVTQLNEQVMGDVKDSHHQLVLVKKVVGDINEYGWNPAARVTLTLINTHTGIRKIVREGLIPLDLMNIRLSPGGNYIVYYDMERQNYLSYRVHDGVTVNISESIPYAFFDEEYDRPGPARVIAPPVWLQNDQAVLLQDYYDIWKVDPMSRNKPICITALYGRQHQVILRFIDALNSFLNGISPKEDVLLAALDKKTKQTGFFKKRINAAGGPHLMILDTFVYYYPLPSWQIHSYAPVRAKNKEVYILERMGVNEAPNLYLTTDLIHFKALTKKEPQKEYNWMTAELLRWKLPNDSLEEGVLYKPENFDPRKKYPVIFSLYERYADELYSYKTPKASSELDIAYYVSNGYLVLMPTIRYRIGDPGTCAFNTVLSAAHYLSQFPWVDSTKLGLQGVSFGAYEVNYIITHSSLFTAAAESAGPVDFISGYGSLRGEGSSNQFIYETNQSRIGATLWEKPNLYIKNSPIFNVDQISTPLLMMHNVADGQVPVEQAYEFFTALRRLGKKAWMLQYENEDHGVGKPKNRQDYSQRLTAFFNHYLKGEPLPEWMESSFVK